MLKRRIAAALSVGALIIGALVVIAAPASATPSVEDCKVLTTQFVDHEDWGNGSPQHWADDTFTRVTTVCHIPEELPTIVAKDAIAVEVPAWLYSVQIADKGTFVTVGGDNSPNDDHQVIAGVHGVMEGSYKTTITAPSEWAYWNSALDGSTVPAGAHPRTGEFVDSLFTQGDKAGEYVWYKWTYTTCNEQWIDASYNHDGRDNSAGDITGSPYKTIHRVKFFTPCADVTFEDVCDGTVVTLLNNAPDQRSRAYFDIFDNKYEVNGGNTDNEVLTFPTDQGQIVVNSKGHEAWTHTWVEPKGCATPVPTPTPTQDVPGGQSPDLPVTGASLTNGIMWSSGVLLLALITAAVGGLLVWRRRRSQQTTA